MKKKSLRSIYGGFDSLMLNIVPNLDASDRECETRKWCLRMARKLCRPRDSDTSYRLAESSLLIPFAICAVTLAQKYRSLLKRSSTYRENRKANSVFDAVP